MILLRPTFGFSEMFTEVNNSGNIQEFKTSLYRKFEEEEKAYLDLPEGGGGIEVFPQLLCNIRIFREFIQIDSSKIQQCSSLFSSAIC